MARDLVPSPVRRAVEMVHAVVPDHTRAVTLVHTVWFLLLARDRGVLPAEVSAHDLDALAFGDATAIAAVTQVFGHHAACDTVSAPLAAALARASRALAGCDCTPEDLGHTYESLATVGRKSSGRYYTASALVQRVVDQTLGAWREDHPHEAVGELTVCDPACGGGAFLLAALETLAKGPGADRYRVLTRCLYGVDVDPGAASVTAMALWLAAGVTGGRLMDVVQHVACADALGAVHWDKVFPMVFGRAQPGFDVVLGNPPWVGFAGRSTVPIDPVRRADLRARFEGFRGFPSLHGAFVTRSSTWLGPGGVLGLLLPSSVADLEGYAPARSSHTAVCEPLATLEEFGEDAFEGVCQPCFALVSRRRAHAVEGTPAGWVLHERGRRAMASATVQAPDAVRALTDLPRLPPELFGEWGFQSAGDIVRAYTVRADAPTPTHSVALLEGRDVREFVVDAPRRYLAPDAEALRRAKCRLRPASEWSRAVMVIRQTARHPIAALYGRPVAFRNSLLAGFDMPGWSPALMVALLNSSLLRAVHLAAQRDGRQRVFPQVKVGHLRALPAPQRRDAATEDTLVALTLTLTQRGTSPTPDERAQLDAQVCWLYGVAPHEGEREALRRFVTGTDDDRLTPLPNGP